MSAASAAFILCIAMFVTKAFSLDFPYNTYIIISVIISVISAAVNISTSARKLFRNAWNLELSSGLSEFRSFLLRIFFLFLYCTAKSHNVFRALIKFGLLSNVSNDIGRICSCVVQFSKICFPNSSIISSKKFTKAKFTVKCISRSVLASGPSHAAKDFKRKLISASMSQLHKILQFIKTYG